MAAINQIITGGIGPGSAIKYFILDGLSPNPNSNPALTADPGAYALTGTDITFVYYDLVAGSGSYSLTGATVSLRWSGAPPSGNTPAYHSRLRLRG